MTVPEGFCIRSALKRDIPRIDELLLASGLAVSGPPDVFGSEDIEIWCNRRLTLVLVAHPIGEPDRIVAHAGVSRKVSKCRRSRADLEDVATHPDFEGMGLSRAIIGRLFWWAQHEWNARRVEWVSADVLERQKARRMYIEVIGAKLDHGTNANFRLDFPWTPGPKMLPHFINPFA